MLVDDRGFARSGDDSVRLQLLIVGDEMVTRMRIVGGVSQADAVSGRAERDVLARIRGSDGQLVDAMFTARPDGSMWVSVDGADLQQLADRISAVCDALYPRQPPHLEAASDAAPTNSSA